MNNSRNNSLIILLPGLLLVALAAVCALVLGCGTGSRGRTDSPPTGDGVPTATADDPSLAEEIAPAQIQYRQTGEITTGLREVYALAVGPDDRLYVAGDKLIRTFDRAGTKLADIPLDGKPNCLAVGGADHAVPGQIYVGMEEHVEVYSPQGSRTAAWKTLGKQAALTSLAAADQDMFAADFGNRIVWHYDASGELKGRIGDPDPARKIRGFFITSRYFDLVVGGDGLLHVVNPLARHIEVFTFEGDLESHWGQGSNSVDGFFGCCNPAHLAVLPDGRFVTAEKGIPRIKVYSPRGEFECVVAGPKQMKAVAADIAADRRGRILALDPSTASVRIFERNQPAPGGKQ